MLLFEVPKVKEETKENERHTSNKEDSDYDVHSDENDKFSSWVYHYQVKKT